MSLEKQKAINTTVKHLIDDTKGITDLKEISFCICKFFKKNFPFSKLDSERESFLNRIALPILKSKSFELCEAEITEKCLITALKNIPNGKSPGHNSLAIEFHKNCWVDLKFYFMKV